MSRMSCMPAGSSPFIGSSRINSWGSPIRQAATPRRWRMPIEYFDTRSSARCRMPTRSRDGSMRSRAAGSRAAARICRFCRPVRWPWNRGSSTMAPTRANARSRCFGHGVSEQGHRAGVGVRQPEQHPDERGLAGAVGAQVAERASSGDQQLDAVDGDVLPETLGQPMGLDRPGARARLAVGRIGQGRDGHATPSLTVMAPINVAVVAVSDLRLCMAIALFPIATVGQAQSSRGHHHGRDHRRDTPVIVASRPVSRKPATRSLHDGDNPTSTRPRLASRPKPARPGPGPTRSPQKS